MYKDRVLADAAVIWTGRGRTNITNMCSSLKGTRVAECWQNTLVKRNSEELCVDCLDVNYKTPENRKYLEVALISSLCIRMRLE